MENQYKFIDKQEFLQATHGGFDFVMRKCEVKLDQHRANNNLLNPFYDDKN